MLRTLPSKSKLIVPPVKLHVSPGPDLNSYKTILMRPMYEERCCAPCPSQKQNIGWITLRHCPSSAGSATRQQVF
jgi:hypothetical protein